MRYGALVSVLRKVCCAKQSQLSPAGLESKHHTHLAANGGVAERFNALVLKTSVTSR